MMKYYQPPKGSMGVNKNLPNDHYIDKGQRYDNGAYEYDPQYGTIFDGEFDQTYPFQMNGNADQYGKHLHTHDLNESHYQQAPYRMHDPHGDCKWSLLAWL